MVCQRIPSQFDQREKAEFRANDKIFEKTIRSRVARGNLNPDHPGTNSLLYKAEKAFVVICIQMGKIRQPLTGPEGVRLFNDMIQNRSRG
jgi:hypothetical protein